MHFTEDQHVEICCYRATHGIILGPLDRVHFNGATVATNSATFNTESGHIYIGDDTIFGHEVHVITGVHLFIDGKLQAADVHPRFGYDIHIGSGCWICTRAVICGGVTIGDNCKIGAGAVVVDDIPAGSFACGVPARVKGKT